MTDTFNDLITLNQNIINKVIYKVYDEYDDCDSCLLYFQNNSDAALFIKQYRKHYKNPVGVLGINGKIRITFNF